MHDKLKLPCTVGLHPCNNYYIYLIVILYPLRCGSIQSQCSAPFAPRPHSRTCSSPYSIRAVSLPHTARSPQCCLNDSCDLLFMVLLDLFLRLLHLHRIVCQSVPATPSLYYHSTKHISSLVRSSVVDLSIFH